MLKQTFSEKVKRIVEKIPEGEVSTYKKVAKQAGNPKAARVVARIMSLNYNKKIPCHRVIKTDGTLGGYNRGGIKEKKKILKKEGYIINP